MALVGCSGFPVPATRYLREYTFVEIADTFQGIPGPALVRRWKREAPAGMVFTAVAPRELSADGFKLTPAALAAWEPFLSVASDLGARAIVVTSAPDLPSNKSNCAAAHEWLQGLLRPELPTLVWEPPPGWDLRDSEACVRDLPVTVVRDPVRHPSYAKTALAYYRLPGPAGYKSRYEDTSLDDAAATVRDTRASEVLVVFANVDMYADSKRLRQRLDD